jgi:hypothetical protein
MAGRISLHLSPSWEESLAERPKPATTGYIGAIAPQ